MNIPDEAVEAATKLFWNEVLGRSDWEEFSQEYPDEAAIVRDNRRCILEAAAPFIIAAKRKKMDLQSEVLEAWYTITKHEVFSPCYAEERPLLHSMLDRLTNLAEMERTVNELRKSSTDDEIRAEERKRVIDDMTRGMIEMWKAHRIEGERKGFDQCHEWGNPPEYAVREANAWVAQDEAFRLIIGNQLADQALREVEE